MSFVYVRICYKKGIARDENKTFELHGLCDCDWCKHKYMTRSRCNAVTAYIDDESKADELKEILRKWKCKDKTKDLPTEYM